MDCLRVDATKEAKPVANKIKIGHVHFSGCTGDLVSIADNYLEFIKILDDYADLVYGLTLVDVRHIPEMDVALIEGSVCIEDHESVEDINETRKKSKVVVALGSCACYGNINRFCRGGQHNQPQHESFLPIGDLIDVDLYIPGCPPSPELIRNVTIMEYLLLQGNEDQKALAGKYLKPLKDLAKRGTTGSFDDLMYEVINQGLCIGCGICAASCPVRAITHEFGKPQGQRDLCINCGSCYGSCPRSFFNSEVISEFEAINDLIADALK
jgi:coenzyme F420 hydrogenase subunit gamma